MIVMVVQHVIQHQLKKDIMKLKDFEKVRRYMTDLEGIQFSNFTFNLIGELSTTISEMTALMMRGYAHMVKAAARIINVADNCSNY